jgi:DNA repair protein RadA/Sms
MQDKRILYVSGEESEEQIKMRADRVVSAPTDIAGEQESTGCYVVSETSMEHIFEHIEAVQPDLVIVDSIQTVNTELIESGSGSISQIRECTTQFQRYAKESGVPVLLVGHITKDGTLAGPKVMEHIVDAVLQFEGDRNYGFRILRALKNRFGSTAEIGIFEMRGSGLSEVSNPSELLLAHRDEELSGTAVAATLEGGRPMFIEVQSLVSSAVYGTPQRNANGFDMRRMNMLLAVLEKRCGFKLGAKDVFLNMAGGMRVNDPALDLAVACSILSSNVDMPISPRLCFAAELGLSGEVRPVSRIEQRIGEADRLGFERIFVSKYDAKSIDRSRYHIQIVSVGVIEEAFRELFS